MIALDSGGKRAETAVDRDPGSGEERPENGVRGGIGEGDDG